MNAKVKRVSELAETMRAMQAEVVRVGKQALAEDAVTLADLDDALGVVPGSLNVRLAWYPRRRALPRIKAAS